MTKKEDNKVDEIPQLAQVDIGEILVKQREGMRISPEIAAKTVKLSKDIIEKLESNRFSEIGASVYVRGYLSLYAKYLGLDESKMVYLYNNQCPAEPITLRPALTQLGNEVERKRYSKTFSLLVSAIVLAGMLYAYYRLEPLLFNKKTEQTDVIVQIEDKDTVASTSDNMVDETESAKKLAADVLKGQPIGNSESLVSDLDLETIELESILANVSDIPVADTSESTEESKPADTDIVISTEKQSLKLTFRADCWLKIKDAKGEILADGIYSFKRPVNAEGKPPFTLTTARVSAIKTVTFNQKVVKLSDYRRSSRRYEIK